MGTDDSLLTRQPLKSGILGKGHEAAVRVSTGQEKAGQGAGKE